ncbi:S49 family peptidase [Devosia rhodophyticola]|uniref:S49 family peptidase n=1 Tax=Devosia rhodophyticola TaxID=3026423 RepID=A0ABY7YWI7_9HYPH|nr:S49 family peptidase [Devosia rhodophyticola]WDR05557.1 S49 family peptidase [Devosia rhodophyticola]
MSTYLPLLAERLLNRPLLIEPAKAHTILSVLEGRIAPGLMEETVPPDASRFIGSGKRPDGGGSFVRALGSTAIITIDGSLVNRGAWLNSNSGLVSYEGIAAQVKDAAEDKDIKNIVLDINSSGGEATGMFSVIETIWAARKTKRVMAVVNDVACSAAYGIASAADRIYVSPTSIVGSIGVVMMHLDRSVEMATKGIRPTLIHAGEHKVDGNPFAALDDDVRETLQSDCDTFYHQFLAFVEGGRKGRLSAKAAMHTEARTYIGVAAIAAGLADDFGSIDEVIARLARPASKSATPVAGSIAGHPAPTATNAAQSSKADAQKGWAKAFSARAQTQSDGKSANGSNNGWKKVFAGADKLNLNARPLEAPATPNEGWQKAFGAKKTDSGQRPDSDTHGWKKAFADRERGDLNARPTWTPASGNHGWAKAWGKKPSRNSRQ